MSERNLGYAEGMIRFPNLIAVALLLLLFSAPEIAATARKPLRSQQEFAVLSKSWKARPLPKQVTGCKEFSEDLLPVQLGNRANFLTKSLKVAFPPLARFEMVEPFSEGLAAVKIRGKFGYIDHSGALVIPAEFEDASSFSCGLARVGVTSGGADKHFWYIDKQGVRKFEDSAGVCVYEECFSEGVKPACVQGTFRFIDTKGNAAFPEQFGAACAFREGLAAAQPQGCHKLGFIDRSGEFVIAPKYDSSFLYAPQFVNGLAPISINEHWGYVDKFGKEIVALKYDWARNFSEGLGAVRIGHKWGFVDNRGVLKIPVKYSFVEDFHDGLCLAYEGGKFHQQIDPACDGGGNFFNESKPVFIDRTGKVCFRSMLKRNQLVGSFHCGIAIIRTVED